MSKSFKRIARPTFVREDMSINSNKMSFLGEEHADEDHFMVVD